MIKKLLILFIFVYKGMIIKQAASFDFNQPFNLDILPYLAKQHILATEVYQPSFNNYQLYQMMKDTHELFTKNDLNYWAVAGTLLGAVRHRGLIPWDDDLDIGIDQQDVPKLLSLEQPLERLGYKLVPSDFLGYKIEHKKPSQAFPFLDIFVCEQKEDQYHYAYAGARRAFSKEWIPVQDIVNRGFYSFGPFSIFGPANATPYLDRVFPGWQTTAMRTHSHTTKFCFKCHWTMAPEHRLPASSLYPLLDRVGR